MTIYTITYILSLLDLAATIYLEYKVGQWNTVISTGSIEGNPIGQHLLSDPIAAIIYKVVVVGCAIFLLWYFRKHKLARIGIWIVFGAFALLIVYHCVCIGAAHHILFIGR